VDVGPETWHFGLVARWWSEFNLAEPEEIAYLRDAIRRFGQPALDLGCGTGRLLLPLLDEGFVVDGADLSPDMLSRAAEKASKHGFAPALYSQAMHELDLPRRYRTIFSCGSFGIGATRFQDRLALRRIFEHLEPAGAFIFSHELPYSQEDAARWARWLPAHHGVYPQDWPVDGMRRRTADGDELELLSRLADFDPLMQYHVLEMRARLWRADVLVAQEEYRLRMNLYFAQELVLMLENAGFQDVAIEGEYTGIAATPADTTVVFVARRES